MLKTLAELKDENNQQSGKLTNAKETLTVQQQKQANTSQLHTYPYVHTYIRAFTGSLFVRRRRRRSRSRSRRKMSTES